LLFRAGPPNEFATRPQSLGERFPKNLTPRLTRAKRVCSQKPPNESMPVASFHRCVCLFVSFFFNFAATRPLRALQGTFVSKHEKTFSPKSTFTIAPHRGPFLYFLSCSLFFLSSSLPPVLLSYLPPCSLPTFCSPPNLPSPRAPFLPFAPLPTYLPPLLPVASLLLPSQPTFPPCSLSPPFCEQSAIVSVTFGKMHSC
jgi:hypothetical protein